VRIARDIQRDLEGLTRPFDAPKVADGLQRLALLAGRLPQPDLMEDGLPAVTA
jgi:hypothetical protein